MDYAIIKMRSSHELNWYPMLMITQEFIDSMPKVELHVHLEGSMRPETLLKLAKKHGRQLPANTVEELKQWYHFKDFPHFAEIYWTCSECLQEPEDLEEITRDFLVGQKAQNVIHSEVTFTALTIYRKCNIPFEKQIESINKARAWGEQELGITMGITIDLPREACSEAEGIMCAEWAVSAIGNGVSAFGLGGYEVGFPPEDFRAAFDVARKAGLPSAPHAGETGGADSIWGSIKELGATRLGHGVRCLEDPKLVEYLVEHQITLEVCPSSNVRLGVVPTIHEHALPKLIAAGLNVTINSDDPPMFSTTLTEEWQRCTDAFSWDAATIHKLSRNSARSAFVSSERKAELIRTIDAAFATQPA